MGAIVVTNMYRRFLQHSTATEVESAGPMTETINNGLFPSTSGRLMSRGNEQISKPLLIRMLEKSRAVTCLHDRPAG